MVRAETGGRAGRSGKARNAGDILGVHSRKRGGSVKKWGRDSEVRGTFATIGQWDSQTMGQVLVFGTSKGGAGKTTLAVNVAASLPGKVLLLDADPQQSAVKWADSASDGVSLPMSVMAYSGERIHREVQKLLEEFDWIVIDTPPSALAVSTVTRSALLAADLAVVPVIPSPLDIWEAMSIRDLLDEINDLREGARVERLETRLLINRLKPRTTFGAEISDALDNISIPVCETSIREREAYKHAALDGCSVHQVKGKGGRSASEEIFHLTRELVTTIG